MLAGDRKYAPCYNFYRKLLTLQASVEEDDGEINPKDYHNYVLLNIFSAFEDIGFEAKNKDSKLQTVNSLVTTKNFEFVKGDITCVISTKSEDHIDLTFNANFKTKKEEYSNLKKVSYVSIDLVPSTTSEYTSDHELIPYFKKKIAYRLSRKYTNAFIVTTVDNTQKDDVIICSPYLYKIDANIRSMIESCIIFSEGDSYIYSHLCPVCGFYIDGEQEDGNCYCANCDSVYSLMLKSNKKQVKESVWIKRLKNPEKL
jgi:hypothetical protein